MDVVTGREREVANVLFQVDKLHDAELRAVLRRLATDDAAFSEAQCSYIAKVIDGTLHKEPDNAANATLTCSSGLSAAVNWEKQFASYSYPGHVCAALRDNGMDDSDSIHIYESPHKQPHALSVADTGDGDTAFFSASQDQLSNTKPSSFVNNGHMVVHYHHYEHLSPGKSTPATASLKRKREEEYSHFAKALDTLEAVDRPKEDEVMVDVRPSKGPRGLKPNAEGDNKENEKPQAGANVIRHPLVELAIPSAAAGKLCKHCGTRYTKRRNKVQPDGNYPCRRHPGMVMPYAPSIESKENGSAMEVSFEMWSCCGRVPGDRGCLYTKHESV